MMKCINPVWLGLTAILLAACAFTPAQRAEQQARQYRQQQALAAALAVQCDAETAALMRRQAADPDFFTAEATAAAAQSYRQKISEPLFQSCYRLAWQNHLNQLQLQTEQQLRLREQMMDDMFAPPRWCQGIRHGRPFWYRCGW